ncbi:MAG: precorrin-6y C5,15-methyltransferase (decarboxylating) subunit CbiE, partial [Negativicutes bacterium]|nr:precorrin-6y C5,15-methyltransferase (decarboxylating) subunit CbiE [Negativicutes bacterium]
ALSTYGQEGIKKYNITGDLTAVMTFIEENLRSADVIVLVSGDPGYYSLLPALKRTFSTVEIEVIPGISSMQVAFSRIKIAWQEATLLSFHGRIPSPEQIEYIPEKVLGMLTDNTYNSKKIAEILLENNWPSTSQVWLCEKLSYDDENIVNISLAEVIQYKEIKHCIMVVK